MRTGGHFHDFIWPLSDPHLGLVWASETSDCGECYTMGGAILFRCSAPMRAYSALRVDALGHFLR
jgi:hypothetical protein